jgi:hypothetical protein
MKDVQKTLTQEQKETVYEFVASWIKSGRKLEECMFNNMRDITDGEICYSISMSTFDINELFSISVNNTKLNLRISVHADDILNKSLVDYITNYMRALVSMGKGELSDEEFNNITNLQVDLGVSRSLKVRQLQEKMK